MQYKKNTFTRRSFLKTLAIGSASLTLAKSIEATSIFEQKTTEMLVYVGTYTSKTKSEGMYIYKLNLESGELSRASVVRNVVDPSYLSVDRKRHYLYAVNELEEFGGKKSGAISAFAINQKTGDLEFLNQQATLGGSPCYVIVSNNEKFVLVANYSGGNVAVFPIQQDGKLGAAIDLEQHQGSSVNRERQVAAHAHFIALDKNNHYAFSCDLGADKIFIYRFDNKTGKLEANPALPFFQTKPGAGPRHLAFHPNDRFAFVINELDSTVTAFSYDSKTGTIKDLQTISTLPAGWTGTNFCADLHVSPDGRFLFGSNRGHDSIVSFKIDEKSGKLEYLEHVATGGKTPRNFTIDPTGNLLLTANQNSNNISVFRINQENGRLSLVNKVNDVPAPVCLKLIYLD